ncbi:MAG: hypothetical protein AAF986_11145, partial [Pseudomonadota bacterium]
MLTVTLPNLETLEQFEIFLPYLTNQISRKSISTKLCEREKDKIFVSLDASFLHEGFSRSIELSPYKNSPFDMAMEAVVLSSHLIAVHNAINLQELPLHCSALKTSEGRAIIFLGASGSGKSTIVANLHEPSITELICFDRCAVKLNAIHDRSEFLWASDDSKALE